MIGELLNVPATIVINLVQVIVGRGGDNKRVQANSINTRSSTNGFTQFCKPFMQASLVIVPVRAGMYHAVWFDKNNPLLAILLNPQNKIGIEPTTFKKSNASSSTETPQ